MANAAGGVKLDDPTYESLPHVEHFTLLAQCIRFIAQQTQASA